MIFKREHWTHSIHQIKIFLSPFLHLLLSITLFLSVSLPCSTIIIWVSSFIFPSKPKSQCVYSIEFVCGITSCQIDVLHIDVCICLFLWLWFGLPEKEPKSEKEICAFCPKGLFFVMNSYVRKPSTLIHTFLDSDWFEWMPLIMIYRTMDKSNETIVKVIKLNCPDNEKHLLAHRTHLWCSWRKCF